MTQEDFTKAIASGQVETENTPEPETGTSSGQSFSLEQFTPLLVALQSTQQYLTAAPTNIPQSFQDQIQFVYTGGVYYLYLYINNQWVSQKIGNTGKFGGTGADGALSISSGTTTINLASAPIVIKNYTSLSITGTANIAFINPSPHGSIVIFKTTGDMTITSTASPVIDMSGQGCYTGNAPTAFALIPNPGNGGAYQGAAGAAALGLHVLAPLGAKYINLFVGAPGGEPGYSLSGIGYPGAGGGSMYFECAGTLNISSQFTSKGTNGVQTTDAGATGGDGGGGSSYNDGLAGGSNNVIGPYGGGGGGGNYVFCANTIATNTATFTLTGGNGRSSTQGKGGDGSSAVILNTEFA
jgi:hypothetical protein